jgi:hypothetical protein
MEEQLLQAQKEVELLRRQAWENASTEPLRSQELDVTRTGGSSSHNSSPSATSSSLRAHDFPSMSEQQAVQWELKRFPTALPALATFTKLEYYKETVARKARKVGMLTSGVLEKAWDRADEIHKEYIKSSTLI